MARKIKAGGKKKKKPGLPSREKLLEYLNDNPDRASKREISRAFGLKGQQKIDLKAMLKDLAADGLIQRKGKRMSIPGKLPSVTVLDIITRDREGGLLAKPVQWDESSGGKTPTVSIQNDPKGKAPVAGIGDRVLARINKDNASGAFRGKVMKIGRAHV